MCTSSLTLLHTPSTPTGHVTLGPPIRSTVNIITTTTHITKATYGHNTFLFILKKTSFHEGRQGYIRGRDSLTFRGGLLIEIIGI